MAFHRKRAVWRLRGGDVTLGVRTLLTARIELSSSGARTSPDAAAVLDRAFELEASGADLVELNPGAPRLRQDLPGPSEELRRLVPVLRKLGPRLGVPIVVLTANRDTARRGVALGAAVIHDPTGLAYDSTLAPAVNETDAAMILGHMRGSPDLWQRLQPLNGLRRHVQQELRASLLRAHKAGIERRRILLDPGLEQGKRGHENFRLLRSLGALVPPGQGVQATLSGKRFFLRSVRVGSEEKDAALAVTATLALEAGAHALTVRRPDRLRLATEVVDRMFQADERVDLGAAPRGRP